jgi:hypothetical protein
MKGTFRASCAIFLATAMFAPAASTPALPLVSYADLGKEVRALKGKVVVVYFWANY